MSEQEISTAQEIKQIETTPFEEKFSNIFCLALESRGLGNPIKIDSFILEPSSRIEIDGISATGKSFKYTILKNPIDSFFSYTIMDGSKEPAVTFISNEINGIEIQFLEYFN